MSEWRNIESAPKRFCADRWLVDGWYSVEFSALDWDDARAFCERAGIRLGGQLMAKIPAYPGGGLLARFIVWLKNRRSP